MLVGICHEVEVGATSSYIKIIIDNKECWPIDQVRHAIDNIMSFECEPVLHARAGFNSASLFRRAVPTPIPALPESIPFRSNINELSFKKSIFKVRYPFLTYYFTAIVSNNEFLRIVLNLKDRDEFVPQKLSIFCRQYKYL